MSKFPIIEGKRFWPFRLNEICDLHSEPVLAVSRKLPDEPKPVCDWVIREVEYPFHLGQPDDLHIWNAYHGKYRRCYRVDTDFWDTASEVAVTRVGDCDGSAILCTALLGRIVNRPRSRNVYDVLGVVKDKKGNVLGGHAWTIVRYQEVPEEIPQWHLIETTLDTPPTRYPVIWSPRRPATIGEWTYEPWVLFNWSQYEEVSQMGLRKYCKLGLRQKETREKYQALQQTYRLPTKPLRRAGVLSRLRRWK